MSPRTATGTGEVCWFPLLPSPSWPWEFHPVKQGRQCVVVVCELPHWLRCPVHTPQLPTILCPGLGTLPTAGYVPKPPVSPATMMSDLQVLEPIGQTQNPFWHVWPLPQVLPHAPQFLVSVFRSTQAALHSVNPAGMQGGAVCIGWRMCHNHSRSILAIRPRASGCALWALPRHVALLPAVPTLFALAGALVCWAEVVGSTLAELIVSRAGCCCVCAATRVGNAHAIAVVLTCVEGESSACRAMKDRFSRTTIPEHPSCDP